MDGAHRIGKNRLSGERLKRERGATGNSSPGPVRGGTSLPGIIPGGDAYLMRFTVITREYPPLTMRT
jgi:hypothetical protein